MLDNLSDLKEFERAPSNDAFWAPLEAGTLHVVSCCYDICYTMFECFHYTQLEIYLFPFFHLLIFHFLKQITGLGVKGIPQNFYAA